MGRSGAAPLQRLRQRQEGAGEIAFLGERFHYGWEDRDFHAERGDRGGLRFIRRIDDESVGEIGVESGDAKGGRVVAKLGEHFVGGAFK